MTDFDLNKATAGGDEATETNTIISQLHGGGGGGGEDAGEFDLTMASAAKKSLPLQAIAVGLVLVVGAGSLYLMRQQGMRAGIDFSNTTIVSAPETGIQRIDNEEEILSALNDPPPEQVPKEMVPGGVFRINKLGEGSRAATGSLADPIEAAKERRRVEIQSALGKLQVESVMHGRTPIAKISGKLFRVNDEVGGIFVLDRIEDRTVILTVDGNEHKLSMVR